ncbi:hypothetical protein [Leifsonia sp. C5G2]|uniref:hypothetical protein n=1 Tax=Leifsonia sp. C5G2 TaxID=2735269 RepID=UPI00158545BD|nr:hypothetical protein [Leifsonia sp. C5G2]NUU05902.1 hypothetical protein [Leifsonia sp. C5G2]
MSGGRRRVPHPRPAAQAQKEVARMIGSTPEDLTVDPVVDPDAPTRSDDGFAVPYLRPGQFISLVHWSRSRDGWRYSTILVQYVSRDDGRWNVLLRGEAASLSRGEWALFC